MPLILYPTLPHQQPLKRLRQIQNGGDGGIYLQISFLTRAISANF